jgi:branched-chain amino acid transport system substrate-binding protein
VSAQSSVIAPLSIDEALRREPSIQRVAVFYAHDDAYSTAEAQIFEKALAAEGSHRSRCNAPNWPTTTFRPRSPPPCSAQPAAGGALRAGGGRRQPDSPAARTGLPRPDRGGQRPQHPNIYPICQRWCDGILIAQAYSPELNTPINRDFRRLYRQATGADPRPPQITAQAFTAYQVLFEAIQRLQQRGRPRGRDAGPGPRQG